jgi:4,5-DOPA dioxygenase extradiol
MASDRQPAVFIGHGSPMNTLDDNVWTRAWRAFGERTPRPRAVLCVSAHWYIRGTAVTAMPRPRTIHDFGGFPQALFDVQYPAPGDPVLAAEVAELLAPLDVPADTSWGLDHGTWSILAHMFPSADVPVVQLAIDGTRPERYHLEVGRLLSPLRDAGVLVMGSGNIVHNLGRIDFGATEPFDWTVRFDGHVQRAIEHRDDALVAYREHPDGLLAAPTPEHYLPLLYVAGARHDDDELTVMTDGYDAGSLSMRSVAYA